MPESASLPGLVTVADPSDRLSAALAWCQRRAEERRRDGAASSPHPTARLHDTNPLDTLSPRAAKIPDESVSFNRCPCGQPYRSGMQNCPQCRRDYELTLVPQSHLGA